MTAPLHVQICNERYLLGFGVDRILAILGRYLVSRDVRVSFACLRADEVALSQISDNVEIISLASGLDLAEADERASSVLIAGWALRAPDVLIIGGWPFFGAAAKAGTYGVTSIFIDAGAVPHDGLSPQVVASQIELRRLRQRTLWAIGCILPISDFILQSQTVPDRGHHDGVETILLGADHLAKMGFALRPKSVAERSMIDRLDERLKADQKLILLGGRYEDAGYKNSIACFRILRQIRAITPNVHLLILSGKEFISVPSDLADYVILLDAIGDQALVEVMSRINLGISTSLWEGFNLPIAEMQQAGKPILAFSVGAHPEVIADPWFLCDSERELIAKAIFVLECGLPDAVTSSNPFDKFRDKFGWDTVLTRWSAVITRLSREKSEASTNVARRRLLLVDVTNSARDPANSGVVRVARRLSAELALDPEVDTVFICWDSEEKTFIFIDPESSRLASNGGPVDWFGVVAKSWSVSGSVERLIKSRQSTFVARPILLIPEIALDGSALERADWAFSKNLATAAILYDLLPIYHADYVSPAITSVFPDYLLAAAKSSVILGISSFTVAEFQRYCCEIGISAKAHSVWLPGQFGNRPRVTSAIHPNQESIHILCVSTIEPRKNHVTLINAFLELRRRCPKLPLVLNLVGNRYVGADDLVSMVEQAISQDDQIVWHRAISDNELAAQYERAAFTVYPSLAEGFGLPILESLWMGCPCLCHETGVMAELAFDGGCLVVDASNAREMSSALEELATNARLRSILREQATRRVITSWSEYAATVANILQFIP